MDRFRTESTLKEGAPDEKRSGPVRFLVDVLETLVLSVILFALIHLYLRAGAVDYGVA